MIVIGIQDTDDFFKIDLAVSKGTEIPATFYAAKINVGTKQPSPSIKGDGCVFHMDVIDPVDEIFEEDMGGNALPKQVRGVEIETEFWAIGEDF